MFAAVASVSAPTNRVLLAKIHNYKDMNLKIFHDGTNDIVLPDNIYHFWMKVHHINPKAELIVFPNDDQNSWDSTYSDPKLYERMLSKKNSYGKL